MVTINGNFGFFGDNGDKKIKVGKPQASQVNNDVPVGKTQDAKPVDKEFGFELLEQGFYYPDLQLSGKRPLTSTTVNGLTNGPFITALNDLQGINPKDDFMSFAMTNIKGVDPDKLSRNLNKPLDNATASGIIEYMDALNV